MCQGYYRHSEGYTPEWPGMADYRGLIKHPQTWDPSFDYSGMRVSSSVRAPRLQLWCRP